ncbi:MAG TPA: ATP-binding protein, partial [Myxococcota bacterium]|nr:ATP-binding protein [Myxococcota bacterium]
MLDYREYPVLYVDDEPENLRIFELTFRREFSVVTAKSGEDGLARLHATPVALVLSDHRMPGMTGVEFLARAAEVDPRAVRILVTGYGDAETLGHAINSGSIYRFVPKPWTPEEMRVTVRRGIEVYALDREREQLLRELTLLNRIAKSMTQELALSPLLDGILATVIEELGYDAAAMLFFDAEGERLAWDRFAPREDAVSEALRGLELSRQTAPGFLRALEAGEVQLLHLEHALSLEGVMRRWVTEVAAEQILVVPLLGKLRALGALAVDNRRGGRRFAADDQTLLEGLATQASIAIENARLVEDLRRSREQVRRNDRLGTLGTLAAGLAHEINNPLVSIHTFLHMAPGKRSEPDAEFWGGYHALACKEVDRIRRLVATMRGLGRDDGAAPPREPFEPAAVVEEVVALLAPEAERARVSLCIECSVGAPKLVAVRDHVHQVLTNLVLNAIHASPAGGEVRLRAAADPHGGGVVFEVQDHGCGIPEDQLGRIFDPFFTTKGPDQGAGLGLMVCHRLVADHGGSIEVASSDASGSTFRVRLPAG